MILASISTTPSLLIRNGSPPPANTVPLSAGPLHPCPCPRVREPTISQRPLPYHMVLALVESSPRTGTRSLSLSAPYPTPSTKITATPFYLLRLSPPPIPKPTSLWPRAQYILSLSKVVSRILPTTSLISHTSPYLTANTWYPMHGLGRSSGMNPQATPRIPLSHLNLSDAVSKSTDT